MENSLQAWERTVGTRVEWTDAGWRAPQPPTPHPSGDRPWPFGRRGLLFCRHASPAPFKALKLNGIPYWNKERAARLENAAHYPIWAGVGAGLADLSNETETRRLPSLNCDPTARMPRMWAVASVAAGLTHDKVVAVHHGCAAAEAEDGEDIG